MPMPKGRLRIRSGLPRTVSNPMDPAPRQSRIVGPWGFNAQPGTALAKLEQVYLSALDAVDAAERFTAQAKTSGRLTEAGIKAAVLDYSVTKLTPALTRGRKAIEEAKQELAAKKAKLVPPAPDKSDAAAAMRRYEFRQWLRGLSNEDRNHYLRDNRGKMDPDEAMAIMEVPASRTGVLDIDRQDLIDRAMRATHGELLDEVATIEAGVELAEKALLMSRQELAAEAGVTSKAFDAAAEPYEKGVGAPWLQEMTEGGERVVRVMDMQRRVWRKPSEDELERGHFFGTWEKYNEAHGRPPEARLA